MEKEKHVAVISSDFKDFLDWATNMNLEDEVVNSKKQIIVGNTTYHCIYKPTHLISMTLDVIVETKNAKKSGAYASMMSVAKTHLKTQK
jgi:hypothetical protein